MTAVGGVGMTWTHLPQELGWRKRKELVGFALSGQITYNLEWLDHRKVGDVVGVVSEHEVGSLCVQFGKIAFDPVVDLGLVVEMGYGEFPVGQALRVWEGGPDVVLEGRRLGGSTSEILGLRGFLLTGLGRSVPSKQKLPEIGDGEDGSGPLKASDIDCVLTGR